jgi:hypothetical protein
MPQLNQGEIAFLLLAGLFSVVFVAVLILGG